MSVETCLMRVGGKAMMSINNDAQILVVDDSDVVRQTLVSYFEQEGYVVHAAANAEQAERLLEQLPIDVVLMDIRLPGKDGLTLTRELRAASEVGIILVTGRQDELDRIVGLECGADEYVTKPFNPREILARVKNLVWRVKTLRELVLREQEAQQALEAQAQTTQLVRLGAWQLDTHRRLLLADDGEVVTLTEGEYQLLQLLCENAGKTLSRDHLMDRLKRRSWDATDRSIDVLIARLRKKLREDARQSQQIVTVHGVGYLFSPAVER